jgi:hypothetical protein
MCDQLSLKHLLNFGGKQAGEDTIFAEEVVQVCCAGELVLDALKRRVFQKWLARGQGSRLLRSGVQ